LAAGGLTSVALALACDPQIDVLYTDEDKISEDGSRVEPFFKPDWCPDQLLSHMYMGHLLVIRRSLFEQLGGLRSAFDGSQDFDLALRATELARKIAHEPSVAYHWRKMPGSTAQSYQAKPEADQAARRALADALSRRREVATVETGAHESTFRVRRAIVGSPLVSIIIPFHDGAELLRRCLKSVRETAGYENWEAVLVDNLSWEPETRSILSRLEEDSRCRVVEYPHPFNWAALNNFAAQQARGEHLLFLNVDVEGNSHGWLAAMLEHSQRPEVGAVGARLLYPDGRVQHAGVIMGKGGGVAGHAFCFLPGVQPGYFGQDRLIRNYSAVTGACMMSSREAFAAVGGFDESLTVAYNDVDYCLRLGKMGLRTVYTPYAELVHEESAARGRASREFGETAIMFRRWEPLIRRDPFFNPNLNPLGHGFDLHHRRDEQGEDPWRTLALSAEKWLMESGRPSVCEEALPGNRF
jgi:O-antigen biosynthesis protein